MALENYNIASNPIDASADRKIVFPLNSDFYQIAIAYSGFTPGAATGFKLHRSVGTNPTEASFNLIADSEQIIADASGTVIYRNEGEERSDFLMLEYTADSNAVDSIYSIITNNR